MASKALTKFQMEQRRLEVARLYSAGWSHKDIAARVGVKSTTVYRDIKIVRERWQAAAVQNIDDRRAGQLDVIDAIERQAQRGWQRSLKDEVTITEDSGGEGGPKTVERTRGQAGNPAFLATMLRCVEQRCKILGLNAPEKLDVTITDASEDELAEKERQLGLAQPRFTLPHMEQQSN